ncbi:MAG: hypothetical protein JXX14_15085 [Deltaproteobacteria bacterium]|nr:hypothetical protein [Deltaproteobacteria bacterium]
MRHTVKHITLAAAQWAILAIAWMGCTVDFPAKPTADGSGDTETESNSPLSDSEPSDTVTTSPQNDSDGIELNTDSVTIVDTTVDTNTDSTTVTDSATDLDTSSENTQSTTDSATMDTETLPDTTADSGTDTILATDSEKDTESGQFNTDTTTADTETVSETSPDTGTETDLSTDTVTDRDTGTDSITDSISDTATDTTEDCLLISEYLEYGAGNRALEIYNCDSHAIKMNTFSICLVRDTDTDCSVSYAFSKVTIPVLSVGTLCHPDLDASYYGACDFVDPNVMTFDGNDRLMLKDSNGGLVDAFGVPASPPAEGQWSNTAFYRTTLTPCATGSGTACAVSNYFTEAADTDTPFSNFGIPPQ